MVGRYTSAARVRVHIPLLKGERTTSAELEGYLGISHLGIVYDFLFRDFLTSDQIG